LAAVLPSVAADSHLAHIAAGTEGYTVAAQTVVGMVVAADMAVVDRAAVHIAVNRAVSADMVPFVHKTSVEQECLPS